MQYQVAFIDINKTPVVVDADGYAHEGPLTTFFRSEAGRRPRLDAWAERIMSIRTASLAEISLVGFETQPGLQENTGGAIALVQIGPRQPVALDYPERDYPERDYRERASA